MSLPWIYGMYGLTALPTLTQFVRLGHVSFEQTEFLVNAGATLLLGGLAWIICRRHDHLAEMALTDSLTGLWNRRKFNLDLPRQIARARRLGHKLTIACGDVDDFKKVNDRLGHVEGDALLVRLGQILRDSLRRGVDRCYRVGGDEFAMILPGIGSQHATELVDRIRRASSVERRAMHYLGGTLSIGWTELVKDESTLDFFRRADALMYETKHRQKDPLSPASSTPVPAGAKADLIPVPLA